MTMTTSGPIMAWPDYLKTKGNVDIKLWDLCEILIVYILLSTFRSVHMVLTVNKPNVRRFIAWIVSWLNPCLLELVFSRPQSDTSHLSRQYGYSLTLPPSKLHVRIIRVSFYEVADNYHSVTRWNMFSCFLYDLHGNSSC